ncbi:hypothetical protein CC78DRAFT_515860 [Lojkania enalia]|uniref:Xylanolytic transcriptional activator regulatory domain-containing protein n=1 Tax=Lojkania enalia TaxID=147567 RepID=A0A9P4KAI4_9PLEO|nr:hypothetical protein CC78DRAFT_515860 [Didymosphaeria enalia]
MASGRVRFFGPTTNMHLLSRSMLDPGKSTETYWPISALVRDLSPETHDYLIDLFFDCHNSNVHIVHKWAFLEDLKSGDTQFYSNFLHMCMLAEGWRYADRTRPDIKRLACPGPDSSTFHTKARKMAELELTKPGGIPSIQAFSLLGDLEAGTGRDDTGWMFAGMAFRLLFDVGLHVDPSELRLAEREVQIRHMVLWACVMNDAYWALYLGRPTMLKASDIAPACLNKDFDRLIYSQSRTYVYGKTIETRIYEALLQLMDLLGPLCETRNASKSLKPTDAQLKIATLDQQLNIWHINLPETLRWSSENVLKAPASFYLLHTQYHTALILLHRTFTTHSTDPQDTAHHNESIHFSSLCRHTCVSNAVQVAEIISMYRKRFPIKRMFVTGLQHIGTAATSIMAEISMIHSEQQSLERERLVKHLADLKMSLEEMSNMYQPAKLMTSVVEHFIRDHGNMMGDHIATTETDTANPLSELSSSSSSSSQQAWIMPIIANDTNPSTSMPSNSRSPFLSPARLQMEETATQLHAAQNRQPSFNSAEGLPFLPSTWFDEMNWEEDDTDFLNLVGLKELQALRGGDLMGNGLGMNGLAEGGAI